MIILLLKFAKENNGNALLALSAASCGVSSASFATVIIGPVGKASASHI